MDNLHDGVAKAIAELYPSDRAVVHEMTEDLRVAIERGLRLVGASTSPENIRRVYNTAMADVSVSNRIEQAVIDAAASAAMSATGNRAQRRKAAALARRSR
jgi:hypothetical protein